MVFTKIWRTKYAYHSFSKPVNFSFKIYHSLDIENGERLLYKRKFQYLNTVLQLKTEFTIIQFRHFFYGKKDYCSHMIDEKGSLQFVVFRFDYIIEIKAMIGKALIIKGQNLILQILILNTTFDSVLLLS